MARPVVIIHFQPLELYPPVMNLIDFIGKQEKGPVLVFTMAGAGAALAEYSSNYRGIEIRRFGKISSASSAQTRYLQYLRFYSTCLTALLKVRPEKILYYETLSSYPAFLYRKYINSSVGIMIHYHEYSSPAEYQSGMKLNRYFHQKERELYPAVEWLSHTNEERMSMFVADEGLSRTDQFRILPNYPGRVWQRQLLSRSAEGPKRIVYAGAVSRETMYFEEFVTWVLSTEGAFIFDVYSGNISESDRDWLNSIANGVRLHPAVTYQNLPDLLAAADIGVILYKGHIPNYVYNAPNKLFEYLACGLDVWVPGNMKGCVPYLTGNTYPKVVGVEFESMGTFNWEAALSREGMEYSRPDYFYESEYPALVEKLFS